MSCLFCLLYPQAIYWVGVTVMYINTKTHYKIKNLYFKKCIGTVNTNRWDKQIVKVRMRKLSNKSISNRTFHWGYNITGRDNFVDSSDWNADSLDFENTVGGGRKIWRRGVKVLGRRGICLIVGNILLIGGNILLIGVLIWCVVVKVMRLRIWKTWWKVWCSIVHLRKIIRWTICKVKIVDRDIVCNILCWRIVYRWGWCWRIVLKRWRWCGGNLCEGVVSNNLR